MTTKEISGEKLREQLKAAIAKLEGQAGSSTYQEFLELWQLTDHECRALARPEGHEIANIASKVWSRRGAALLAQLEEQPDISDRELAHSMRLWQCMRLLERQLRNLPGECQNILQAMEQPETPEDPSSDDLY